MYHSKQEVFDVVVKHLLTQNEVAQNGDCKYRTASGLKCAAGCLIPDELYDPMFEGALATGPELKKMWPKVTTMFMEEFLCLVLRLQSIHDNNRPENWDFLLRFEAGIQGLTYPFPEVENV